jgi:hypothetical protein
MAFRAGSFPGRPPIFPDWSLVMQQDAKHMTVFLAQADENGSFCGNSWAAGK